MNERFFDTWSAEMAYVLGFWFADGYMRKDRSYRIIFTSADKSILLQIRNSLSSSHPVRRKVQKGYSPVWELSLCSKHLYKQLQKLGGYQCKSITMTFPHIPSRFLADFIRGYFDGDGSVFFVTYVRTKDKCLTKELRTNFTSGSLDFLDKLMMVLHNELKLSLKQLAPSNDRSYKLGYGMKDSDALLRYMYYANFPIGLERKARFVSQIPEYERH